MGAQDFVLKEAVNLWEGRVFRRWGRVGRGKKKPGLVQLGRWNDVSLFSHSIKIPMCHRRTATTDESQATLSYSSSGFVYLCLINWTDGDISVILWLFPYKADNTVCDSNTLQSYTQSIQKEKATDVGFMQRFRKVKQTYYSYGGWLAWVERLLLLTVNRIGSQIHHNFCLWSCLCRFKLVIC